MAAEVLYLLVNNPDVSGEISFGCEEHGTMLTLVVLPFFVNGFHVSRQIGSLTECHGAERALEVFPLLMNGFEMHRQFNFILKGLVAQKTWLVLGASPFSQLSVHCVEVISKPELSREDLRANGTLPGALVFVIAFRVDLQRQRACALLRAGGALKLLLLILFVHGRCFRSRDLFSSLGENRTLVLHHLLLNLEFVQMSLYVLLTMFFRGLDADQGFPNERGRT